MKPDRTAEVTLFFILSVVYVFLCAHTPHNKDSFYHFWTAIRVPPRKLSRWVWNMQQFVWSLRCLFRSAFACNYNRLGNAPCYWCIPFVLRSNFLFLREKSSLVSFNAQPTSISTPHSRTEIALYLQKWLQDCNCCKKCSGFLFHERDIIV